MFWTAELCRPSQLEVGRCKCPLWVISGHRSAFEPCPLYPRKQTSFNTAAISALCQKRKPSSSVRRSSTGRFQTKPGTEFRHAVEVNVQFIFLQERRRFDSVRPDRTQLPPVVFKTGRRNNLNNFTWRVARVPERMPLAARLEHPGAGLSCDDGFTKQCAKGTS
jgi:hypothetical protein